MSYLMGYQRYQIHRKLVVDIALKLAANPFSSSILAIKACMLLFFAYSISLSLLSQLIKLSVFPQSISIASR